jgi:hypothetical protein
MKNLKLFFVGLLVCGLAHAETWFEMPNRAGGKIVLFLTECKDKKEGRIVVATAPDGTNSTGCWTYYADLVIVIWDRGDIRTSTFNPEDFQIRERK